MNNKLNIVVIIACNILLSGTLAMAGKGFVDNFEGPTLNKAWSEKNGLNCKGLEYKKPLKGSFEISSLTDTNPAKLNVVSYSMQRSFEKINGDFTATMDLNWNQMGVSGMTSVKIAVLSSDGKVLSSAGMVDGWIAGYAKMFGSVGKKEITGMAIPDKSSAKLKIERTGENYTIKFREFIVLIAKGSTQDIASVKILVKFIDYPPYKKYAESHFGVITIDKIAIIQKQKYIKKLNNKELQKQTINVDVD